MTLISTTIFLYSHFENRQSILEQDVFKVGFAYIASRKNRQKFNERILHLAFLRFKLTSNTSQ